MCAYTVIVKKVLPLRIVTIIRESKKNHLHTLLFQSQIDIETEIYTYEFTLNQVRDELLKKDNDKI